MKFKVTMKDPDCLHDAIREAVEAEVGKLMGLFASERKTLIDERIERVYEGCSKKWFRYGEYLDVEIDTDAGTATVVPE